MKEKDIMVAHDQFWPKHICEANRVTIPLNINDPHLESWFQHLLKTGCKPAIARVPGMKDKWAVYRADMPAPLVEKI